jgi:hypothetical protein
MFFSKKKQKQQNEETRREIKKISTEIAKIWNSEKDTKQFDANGWYTGNPKDSIVPEQDADDL